MARFQPPDHTKGDANTLGGYMAVHDRPAAFEGGDGFSYSAEIVTDHTGEPAAPYASAPAPAAAPVGAQSPEGHLETDYLATATTEASARAAVGSWKLSAVKAALDDLIAAQRGAPSRRRWWDAMRDEDGGGGESAE